MPTDEDNVLEEDTLEEPTAEDNAEEVTESPEEDYAALAEQSKQREIDARKKMDQAAIENKQLRKEIAALKGEEIKETPVASIDESYIDWKLDNGDKIDLVKEEYTQELEELKEMGVTIDLKAREKALSLALHKKGITTDNMTTHLRQAQTSASASTDRSDVRKVPKQVQEDMQVWGFSEDTYLKHKDSVLEKR